MNLRPIVPGLTLLAMLLAGTSHAAGLGVTPADQFGLMDGFEAELVYEVPSEEQGSWVSLTTDPKGRLIACDQYGGLYRIDVSGDEARVEQLEIEFVGAQGLLHAFGSLYANVNTRGEGCGVWRLTDTDNDDQYDKKEHIVPLNGGSEHGPHAMILTPDGKRILMCAGNNTNLPELARSRVPRVWQEDHLLGRMPDARGHNADRLAPGGFILSMKPDGTDLELIATGFRNEYDLALNRDGELFTYDADMEWDVGTPWYRPTRVNHVISGAEFGWRNGTGKWPAYYPDSFGAAVDIGPGSPTGICFGYGTNFPPKYQDALFIADWSYGNIFAVHLNPDGSTYSGTYETFATAAPLPVTDMVVRHEDGCLYFTVGGRRTQSGLYRIRYSGADAAQSASAEQPESSEASELRDLRRRIEATHVGESQDAVDLALENLTHEDHAIRFVARIALEHQPLQQWKQRALQLDDSQARILAVVALARHGGESDQQDAFAALTDLSWEELPGGQRIDLLRALALASMRLGEPNAEQRKAILDQIGGVFPTGDNRVDRELAKMLVYLDAPGAVKRILKQMENAPSQEDQIHYAMVLRKANQGWNLNRYRRYFRWFNVMQSARGGMSFGGFLNNIKAAALENVPEKIQEKLADVLEPAVEPGTEVAEEPRDFVQKWEVSDLIDVVANTDRQPDFERGKKMFSAAQCYKCHRMGVQGGILGPDLTGAGGRFNYKDLLESIVEPNRVISDQYGATRFLTSDGRLITGRVVNMSGDQLRVMTNMLDPSKLESIKRDEVEQTMPATNSMMPAGLLDTLGKEEVADLIAYLRAGGNPNHPIYNKTVAKK